MEEKKKGKSKYGINYNLKFGHPRLHHGALKYKMAPPLLIPYKLVLPSVFSLEPSFKNIPVQNQNQIGDCVAFACGSYHQYLQQKKEKKNWVPSHLFIYWNGRAIGGYPESQDTGMTILDGVEALSKFGVCPETEWPYYMSNMTLDPPQACFSDALPNRVTQYYSVTPSTDMKGDITMSEFKHVLVQGYPIVCGIQVYSSFESAAAIQSGDIPMPNTATEEYYGGHAILVISWSDETKRVGFLNSWGVGFGKAGYGTLPYEYILNPSLADEFYVMQSINSSTLPESLFFHVC
jgi:C1A family cysteine protease